VLLDNCTFSFPSGAISLIIGPNGCGKSTLLKILSRLDQKHDGLVYLNNQVYFKPSPDVMLLHQSLEQLFFWLNVEKNICLPLLLSKVCKTSREAKNQAHRALELVGMKHLFYRYPFNLSGGEKQRVALARAIAFGAKVLLLDEPFSATDKQTRSEMIRILADLAVKQDVAVIIVTHSPEEFDGYASNVLDLTC